MNLLTIILTIVVVGVVLWVINAYIPMEGGIKKLLNVVVIVFLVIWLLKILGVWAYLSNINV